MRGDGASAGGGRALAACETSIPGVLEAQVRKAPHRLAVTAGQRALTYAQLEARANAIAWAVVDALGPGAHPVAVLLPMDDRLVAAFLGLLEAGKVVVPLDPRDPVPRLIAICRDAGATLLITGGELLPEARGIADSAMRILDLDALPRRDAPRGPDVPATPDALALLVYTSGSAGTPKGVAHSHRSVLRNAFREMVAVGVTAEDRVALVLPASTLAGAREIMTAIVAGACAVAFDHRTRGLTALAGWVQEEAITHLTLSASLFRHLVGSLAPEARLPLVRVVRLGSEALTPADLDSLRRHFAPACVLCNGYGLTETGTVTGLLVTVEASAGVDCVTAGAVHEDVEVRVLDEAGVPLAPGEIGEVVVASRYLATGYWRHAERAGEPFASDAGDPAVRRFPTGDLGRFRPDGSLEILGRRDAMLKVRGQRVEPAEVEQALLALPGVAHAAVRAFPSGAGDAGAGDVRLAAYVVPGANPVPTGADLRRHLLGRLPAHMVPAAFTIVPSLPLTSSGKVDRGALREPAWTVAVDAATHVAPRTPIEVELAALWADTLGVERVGITTRFTELGGDSLKAAALVARVLGRFGVALSAPGLLASSTIEEMALLVVESLAARVADGDEPAGPPR